MTLLAHLGHGLGGLWHGMAHPLTGFDHLVAMVAVGILAAVVVDRRVAWATPAAFVGGMVVGGIAGIAGVAAGPVETVIAASVVALGGLIAASSIRRVRLGSWVPVVALAFGAAHGLAHGAEVPGSASPLTYVIGFVTATVALHLAGVALGSTVGRQLVARTALAGAVSLAGVMVLAGVPI